MSRKILSTIFALLIFSAALYAQIDTRGLKVKMKSQAGKRSAICIGINNYTDNKLNSLKKAVNDAYGLSDVLSRRGVF